MDDLEGKNKKGRKSSSNTGKVATRSTSSENKDELKFLTELVEKQVDEYKGLKEKVEESLKANEFISEKYDEFKKINEEVLEKLKEITFQNKKLMEKNELLEKQLLTEKEERIKLEERMHMALTPIELEKRSKNLELYGYSESENENCNTIAKDILAKITPKNVEVSNCFRTGPKFSYTGERRTRPILLKFSSQEHREVAFAARSNLRNLENQNLYLNEHLPPYLKMLRGKANKIRKEKGYAYLWMKNGNLLVRKDEESNVIAIKNMSDLEKIK